MCRLLQWRERQPGRLRWLPGRAVHGRVRPDGVPELSGGPVPAEPVAEPVPAVRRGHVRQRDGTDGVCGLCGGSSAVPAGPGQLHVVHAGSVHRRAEADGVLELLARCGERARVRGVKEEHSGCDRRGGVRRATCGVRRAACAGLYQNGTAQLVCVDCGVGQFQALSSATRCEPCLAGTFSTGTPRSSCLACEPGRRR